MTYLAPATTVAALIIVRGGGELGITLPEFAKHWPSRLPAGQKRQRLSGVGQVMGALVQAGLVCWLTEGRRHRRFGLTNVGEKLLAAAAAEAEAKRR